MDKLLACPWCGKTPVIETDAMYSYGSTSGTLFYVTCRTEDCNGQKYTDGEYGCTSPEFKTEEEAIKAWNTRTNHFVRLSELAVAKFFREYWMDSSRSMHDATKWSDFITELCNRFGTTEISVEEIEKAVLDYYYLIPIPPVKVATWKRFIDGSYKGLATAIHTALENKR